MDSPEQVASEVAQRIAQLDSMHDVELRGEMAALKKAILENPQAATLLMDEDVGKLVAAFRRITGQAISKAAAAKETKAAKKAAPKTLSMEELNKRLKEVGDEF